MRFFTSRPVAAALLLVLVTTGSTMSIAEEIRMPRTISVSATGTVTAEPDLAAISTGVVAESRRDPGASHGAGEPSARCPSRWPLSRPSPRRPNRSAGGSRIRGSCWRRFAFGRELRRTFVPIRSIGPAHPESRQKEDAR